MSGHIENKAKAIYKQKEQFQASEQTRVNLLALFILGVILLAGWLILGVMIF